MPPELSPGQQENTVPAIDRRPSTSRSKYVSKACQACRGRRAKCDGKTPCARCIDRKLNCIYAARDIKRGTAPMVYVHQLQSRISLLEKILWLHSIDIDEAVAQLKEKGDFKESDSQLSFSKPLAELDQLSIEFSDALSLEESLDFDHSGETRYFGPSSGRPEFWPLLPVRVERYRADADCDNGFPDSYGQQLDLYSQAVEGLPEVSEELESHLVDLYFFWEQPWTHIVDERLFRESKEIGGRYFSPLLLSCILATGSRYSDRPELRYNNGEPNTAGCIFLETAEALIHFELKCPGITTLQSLAILGTLYIAFGYDATGWLYQGMANRLALDMGLNLDPNRLVELNRISHDEARLRRQLYWALYSTDKLSSSYTGRVCTMLDSQAAVSHPGPSLHADNSSTKCSHDPVLLSTLQDSSNSHAQILEKILCNLYGPKQLIPQMQRQSFFDSCLLMLKGWYYSLSSDLKPGRSGSKNMFPHAYTLCMVYHTSIILLTKPFLPSTPGSQAQKTSQKQGSFKQKAASLSLEAAEQVSLLGDLYREAFGSFRLSPITATHCTLSAVLALLHGFGDQGEEMKPLKMERVDSCTKTLMELSESWTPARRYYHRVKQIVQARSGQAFSNSSGEDLPPSMAIEDMGFNFRHEAQDFLGEDGQRDLQFDLQDTIEEAVQRQNIESIALFPDYMNLGLDLALTEQQGAGDFHFDWRVGSPTQP